jgi:2'-5' RNA ligase
VTVWQRHFLALVPDEAARSALAAVPVPAGARPTRPGDLHVTVAFLGTLERSAEQLCREAARRAAAEAAPVACSFDAVDVWPVPRVLCAVESRPAPALQALAARVEQALVAAGFEREPRAYRPHVTLARGVGEGWPARLPVPVRWTSRELRLMASPVGGPAGYATVDSFPLGRA